MDQVNRSNPTPLYEQLKFILRDQILLGKLPSGSTLPSEQEFCQLYDVSRITVSRALTDLAREGLIQRTQGKNSIVSHRRIQGNLNRIIGHSGHMKWQDIPTSSKILKIVDLSINPSLASAFMLPTDSGCMFTRFTRLRFANNIPVVLMHTTVRKEVGDKIRTYDLEHASFYQLYEEILQRLIVRNETTLIPILATAEIADHLGVKLNSPQFSYRAVGYLEGEIPVEFCEAVYRGDMFEFSASLYRFRKNNGEY